MFQTWSVRHVLEFRGSSHSSPRRLGLCNAHRYVDVNGLMSVQRRGFLWETHTQTLSSAQKFATCFLCMDGLQCVSCQSCASPLWSCLWSCLVRHGSADGQISLVKKELLFMLMGPLRHVSHSAPPSPAFWLVGHGPIQQKLTV